ncbi:hypothetical protein JRO89_XS06G0058700 [Xanthoceras sorbifolium]|uniref:Uncharacterized protein n=1 Tax=Xanthoceras sorbifolium TaxID=99658 RepID=A0ABQ8HWU4_9ROSI|nr:hypothetical protein JRO89_XS06G0058700 [Xanthoceras sorbifolium]
MNVMKFKSENNLNVRSEYDYPGECKNNSIAAAFLELPYERVFITHDCKGYTATTPTYRFGGFVFQKGSPIAADFSEAILKLSENGMLKSLEDGWFVPSSECSANATNKETESLSLSSFWGLYLISGATSTICFILFLVSLLRNYRHDRQDASKRLIWSEAVKLARYICDSQGMQNPGRVLTSAGTQDADIEMQYILG